MSVTVAKKTKQRTLFTIGYEGLDLERFLKFLTYDDVKVLVDVRELAFSRKKGFSKTALSSGLEKVGIEYVHLRDLGSPRDVRKQLFADKDYDSFFEAYKDHLEEQEDALAELGQLIDKHEHVCVMCFEKAHEECHRSLLADYLHRNGNGQRFKVEHINTWG